MFDANTPCVTFFSAKDNIPKPSLLNNLEAQLLTHVERPDKDGACFSPVTYKPGVSRGGANVLSVHALVLDCDHLSVAQAVALETSLSQYSYILHTTHTHNPPDDCRLRIILPISRSLSPIEYGRFREAFITRHNIPADPATKDPSRIFFLPSTPPGKTPWAEAHGGETIQVERYLTLTPAPSTKKTVAPPEDLDEIRTHLRRVRKAESMALIKTILAGEPLAVEGRDLAMHKASGIMAFSLPVGTPKELMLEILRPSIEAMPSDNTPQYEMDKLEEKLDRALERRAAADRDSQAISQSFDSKTGGYTVEELEAFAKQQKCTVAEFKTRWIIQCGPSYWVYVDGGYRSPWSREDILTGLKSDFARAPCDIYKFSKTGEKTFAPLSDVLLRYGTSARAVRADISIPFSYYDAKTETFHEAVCPRTLRQGVFHQEVQTWLELLGGPVQGPLLDWVASVTHLEQQCAALFVEGPPGVGKTLLAYGLARLWGKTMPTSLESVLSDFNETLAGCPLVFSDEGLPAQIGKNITAELRKLLGQPTRTLRRKYLKEATMTGNIRLMVCSNNDRFPFDEMGEADREAVAQRILYVRGCEEAKTYLETLPRAVREDFKDKRIAEHALWLRENRQVIPGKRFLVEGRESSFHTRLSINNGLNPAICEFLVGLIIELNPALENTWSDRLLVGGGEVLVTGKAFGDKATWERLAPGTKFPPTTDIHRALRNMRQGQRQLRTGGMRPVFNIIKVDLLVDWARETGACDVDLLVSKIGAKGLTLVSAE